ncbi:endoribonuclease L-PSP [Desulfacinum hydrothermale DSM 13146]|uniref:Endoribonuclease L-PSP n=1 Tax=Desulfacinum hydrothermale DSM 13146 TaxID=1121390 RepID=A0A1W1XDZ2_9BACT|nr:RidA family protein [Desulfacinum hydrothermale]SMC21721.1 endoribonuclease L-PSP [Desulfacinum hydrothermale DSM 13146]
MALEFVQTDKAPAAIGPYSQAVQAGPWVYVSGQIPLVPETGEMVGDDFQAQARQVLANVKAVLEAAGCHLSDVVAVDVFLTDLGPFQVFNRLYADFFGEHKPARAVVEVSALPKGALLEMKCVACRS